MGSGSRNGTAGNRSTDAGLLFLRVVTSAQLPLSTSNYKRDMLQMSNPRDRGRE